MGVGFQSAQIMICLICRKAELIHGFTSVPLNRGEVNLLIKKVPARVCPGCDEAFVEEHVASSLLVAFVDMSAQGIREGVQEYIPATA